MRKLRRRKTTSIECQVNRSAKLDLNELIDKIINVALETKVKMTNEISIKEKPSATYRILEGLRMKTETTKLRADLFILKLKQCIN
ncbi:MAG: hypothetical protein GY861_12010 [bacterium]|nr:hypothetical protein [bacterium]